MTKFNLKFAKPKMKKVSDNVSQESKAPKNHGVKVRSIKSDIQFAIIILLVLSLTLMGAISAVANLAATKSLLQTSMTTIATESARQIYYSLDSSMTTLEAIGGDARFSTRAVSVFDKQTLLNGYRDHYGWQGVYITDEKGATIGYSSIDVSGSDYVNSALAGTAAYSDPILDPDTGSYVITIAAPLWADGKIGTSVNGAVIAFVDVKVLSDVVSNIKVSENGGAYIINSQDIEIADANFALVEQKYSVTAEYALDPSLADLYSLHQRLLSGETGFGEYHFGSMAKYGAFAPIGINGWGLMITAPTADFMQGTYASMFAIAVVMVLFIICGIVVANRIGNRIGKAISQCAERLQLLAQGDLETPVAETKLKNEIKILTDSTKKIVEEQRIIIGDVDYLLTEMAHGNFDIESRIGEEGYVGYYGHLLSSIRELNGTLGSVLADIRAAAEQIDSGSNQVSAGAQNLSQGATEQASAIEELAATIADLSDKVNNNAQNAVMANEMSGEAGAGVVESNNSMKELMTAMGEINDTASNIGKIIKTIEDIAFQTNILALNAAVEAARAGAAGKGFAVVADEVRNLAGKSAEAAKNTNDLIGSAIKAIQAGTEQASATAASLETVVTKASVVNDKIAEITTASEQQATALAQVETGIEQISAVVQTNSATAEQSAASSEELSAQANMLKTMVNRFRFR